MCSKNNVGNIASSIILALPHLWFVSLSLFRNRVRHVDEHFDLDLTYITDRIIGMTELDIKEHCFCLEAFDIHVVTKKCYKKLVRIFPASSGILFCWQVLLTVKSLLMVTFYLNTSILRTAILVPLKQEFIESLL